MTSFSSAGDVGHKNEIYPIATQLTGHLGGAYGGEADSNPKASH